MMHSTEFIKAQRHFLRGEYERSITDFNSALKYGMDASKIHIPLGMAHFKNGDFFEAVKNFNLSLDTTPANDYVRFLRGIAYFNNGDVEKAVDDFTDAIRFNGRRGAAYIARSLAFKALQREAEAERDLRSAVALGDVEVELFIREYCLSPMLYGLAMSLFDVGKEEWGRELQKKHASNLTH
jgi:tetratricopeptide (TPR) repeat protein